MFPYQYEEIYKTIKVRHFTKCSASFVSSFKCLWTVRHKRRTKKTHASEVKITHHCVKLWGTASDDGDW